MPDLTSPAASSIALPTAVAPPSANPVAVPGAAAFCEVLLGKVFQPQLKMPTGDGDRQGDAATGNPLPEKDKEGDPALAWLLGAAPMLVPVPAAPPIPPDVTTKAPPILEGAPDIAPDVLRASGAPAGASATANAQGNCDVVDAKPRMFTLPLAAPIDQSNVVPQPPSSRSRSFYRRPTPRQFAHSQSSSRFCARKRRPIARRIRNRSPPRCPHFSRSR